MSLIKQFTSERVSPELANGYLPCPCPLSPATPDGTDPIKLFEHRKTLLSSPFHISYITRIKSVYKLVIAKVVLSV